MTKDTLPGLLGPDGAPYQASAPAPNVVSPFLEWLLGRCSKLFYALAGLALLLLSLALLGNAGYILVEAALSGASLLQPTLEGIGLVTIALAVYEVGKFLIEEELVRERQLRSMVEARRSLTKFFTIIIIILSLEAIVLVFETKLERIADLVYPSGLMAVAVAALVGLGLFLWLSSPEGANASQQPLKRPD